MPRDALRAAGVWPGPWGGDHRGEEGQGTEGAGGEGEEAQGDRGDEEQKGESVEDEECHYPQKRTQVLLLKFIERYW